LTSVEFPGEANRPGFAFSYAETDPASLSATPRRARLRFQLRRGSLRALPWAAPLRFAKTGLPRRSLRALRGGEDWWRRRESNPRPRTVWSRIYML